MSRFRKTRSRQQSSSAHRCRPRVEKLEDRRLLAVLFADSFEQSEWNGNWVEDSQNDWFRSSQRAADGSRSAEVDGSASDAALSLANPIDLTTYGSAELTYSWYIESGFDSGEYIALDLYDGTSWNEVASLQGNVDQENIWHNETITIDANYLVADFQARFRAKVSDSREDGFVDNVKIEGIVANSQIAISDAEILEGDSGNTSLVYTVSRSGNISQATAVDFTTVAGTAAEGVDYVGSAGTLTFPAGDSSPQTITVQVNGDTSPESDESFFVNLSNAVGGTLADAQGTGTILDDDAVPTISYSDFSDPTGLNLVRHATAPAGTNNALRLTPELTSQQGAAWFASPQWLSVGFETVFEFQTAGNGSDGFAFVVQNNQDDALGGVGGGLGYQNVPNSLAIEFDTFQNSETNDPNDNHVGVHTMGAAPNSNQESASLGTVTPAFDINDGNIHQVKVVYQPGTMTIFLDDFVTPAMTVAVDLAETLDLDVGKGWVGFTGVSGGGAQSHDILSWEYSVLADVTTTIGVADAQVTEGDSGVTNMVFTVTRDGDTSGTAIVSGVISDGTATIANGDYGTLDSATLSFAAGQTTGTFVLPINGDQTPEAHETLTLNLTLDSGTATLVDAVAIGTILNDDTSVAISDATALEAGSSWELADTIALGGGISGWPWGVAKGTNGDLFIAFSQINGGGGEEAGIEKIDGLTGEIDHDFVPIGTAGLFNAKEIEVHGGWIYVSNKGTNEVLRFDEITGAPDPAGAFISSGAAGLANPRGIVFDAAGDLIVSSKDTDQLLKFSGADGTYLGVFVASVTDGGAGSKDLAVDAAGDIYVNGNDRIYKFSGVDGTPLGLFVQNGLVNSSAIEFGPDGDLYVGDNGTSQVFQFNGQTGDLVAAIDIDTAYGKPVGLAFDNAGTLYVGANLTTGELLRYAPGSSAVFTVSLSSSSVDTVTVDYLTNNVTAMEGSDYTGASGTLVFEPGVTSRAIIIPTIDDLNLEVDESFTITLSNPNGATIVDDTGLGTIVDNEVANLPPSADAGADRTIRDGDAVTLNGNGTDSDGTIVGYQWTEGATVLGTTASISPTLNPGTHTLTLTVTDDDGATASDTVIVTVEQPSSETPLYVYDIRFESYRNGRYHRAVFEIRSDSNSDGQGSSADAIAPGVAITVQFDGRTYTGTTDSNGVFVTSWRKNVSSGTYAEVVDLALTDFTWDPLALDLEDDTDGDGLPDATL